MIAEKKEKENQRIWVAAGIKERLEALSEESGVKQERIIADVLDYYESASSRDLNVAIPELQSSVSILEMETSRLIHRLALLEDIGTMLAVANYNKEELM